MNTLFFDDINSYYDLNLILQPFEFPPAEPKTQYLEIPGADGDIDLTEALGDVKYKSRSASAVFSVLPSDDWEQKKSEVSNLLNGRKFKIQKSSDPDYYFVGRCSINDYKCDKFNRTITVDMHLRPWKLKNEVTVVEVTGLTNYVVKTVVLKNNRMPAVLNAVVKKSVTIVHGKKTYPLPEGAHILSDLVLSEGDNVLKITGHMESSITFTYQEGSL